MQSPQQNESFSEKYGYIFRILVLPIALALAVMPALIKDLKKKSQDIEKQKIERRR